MSVKEQSPLLFHSCNNLFVKVASSDHSVNLSCFVHNIMSNLHVQVVISLRVRYC